MAGRILLVVHRDTSEPGRVGAMLSTLGFDLDLRRPACGDPLPETLDGHAGVVVFGGAMSANDDHLPFIRAELDWIPKVLAAEVPYLGICLGAQLLARSLGSPVTPHPDGLHEIGYYELVPTDLGRPLFEPGLHAYQWHGEGVEVLPAGAAHLAESAYFPHQAFRYGTGAYGLQFHPEVTEPMMRLWTTIAAHRLTLPGAQSREEQHARRRLHDAQLGAWLNRFLRHWLGCGDAPSAILPDAATA